MAYAQTDPVVTRDLRGGRYVYVVTFTETEAAAGSEWSIAAAKGLPLLGTIVLYKATLYAGTGTTIQPAVGRAAGVLWTIGTKAVTSQAHIGQVSAAAVVINDATGIRYRLLDTGIMYGRSTPNNAAADHSVVTELHIIDGVI